MEALQRKAISTAIKALEEPGSFEAIIATIGVKDHDGDVVEAGALDGLVMSIMPAHQSQSVPLGKAVIEERGPLAVAVGKFNLEVSAGRDWYHAIKFDLENSRPVQEWSWGYRPKEWRMGDLDGEAVRYLSALDVEEISPVLRGASIGTRTLLAKSAKTETSEGPWDAGAELRARLKADPKADTLDGVGYPHHFADGKASTRACVAAIVDLNLRGGSDRKAAYEHLAAHLTDAGIEPPELLDSPGVKLIDQVNLVTWSAEAAAGRVSSLLASRAEKGRPVNDEVKAAAVQMATAVENVQGVVKQLAGLVEDVIPDDPLVAAIADYQAAGLRRVLKGSI